MAGLRGVVILIVIVIGAFAEFAAAQPYLPGIDVSNYQGNVNWTSVKNAGIKFAFAKATEGVDFVDAKFTQNMTNAINAGMLIGPYHFGRPDSAENNPNDAIDEANDFVDAIQGYYAQPGHVLRPVLDVERLPTPGEFSGTQKAYVSKWIRDFASVVVNRLGFAPIIYANTNYATNYFESNISQYDFWLANYNYTPPSEPPASATGIWSDWDFWQFTASGTVSGISGAVDRNVFEGTMDDLLEFVPFEPSGDFNRDGDVDGRDFLAWQRNVGLATGVTFAKGDANHDGEINATDLAIWQTQYANGSLAGLSTVPEPSTLLLGSLCSALVLNRRTR